MAEREMVTYQVEEKEKRKGLKKHCFGKVYNYVCNNVFNALLLESFQCRWLHSEVFPFSSKAGIAENTQVVYFSLPVSLL